MKAPVFLTTAGYYGTLAATRCLGRAGIPVVLADEQVLVPGRWSRYVTRRVDCPSVLEDPDHFIEWLLDWGRRHPGHVLYPASDDHAWLYARHRDALSRDFRLYSPELSAVHALLDKKRLLEVAAEVGLQAPKTWFPARGEDFETVARQARFPVLIKPRTQVLYRQRAKGARVDHPDVLREKYAAFESGSCFARTLLAHDPTLSRPAVQEFLDEAAGRIYSLTGFIDRTGEQVVLRGALKVLQQPRNIGIGLCFSHAEVKPELAEKLVALCRKVGYHGLFEVELVQSHGRSLLIDFNPRYYSQMAFELDRGMPLPLMVHAAATGDAAELGRLVDAARAWRAEGPRAYCNRFVFEVMMRSQRLAGRVDAAEEQRWRTWLADHGDRVTDALHAPDDPIPTAVDALTQLYRYARHPRFFVRRMVLDRQGA